MTKASATRPTAATRMEGLPNCGTPALVVVVVDDVVDVIVVVVVIVVVDDTDVIVIEVAVRGSSRLNHALLPFVRSGPKLTVPSLASVIAKVAVLDS